MSRKIPTKRPSGRRWIISSLSISLWYPTVKKGDILPAGALLGEVRDFWNNPLGEYRTLYASRVLYHHTGLPLRPGDGLAACAHTEEAFILEDLEATVQRFLS